MQFVVGFQSPQRFRYASKVESGNPGQGEGLERDAAALPGYDSEKLGLCAAVSSVSSNAGEQGRGSRSCLHPLPHCLPSLNWNDPTDLTQIH